jgi:hypothetical protein
MARFRPRAKSGSWEARRDDRSRADGRNSRRARHYADPRTSPSFTGYLRDHGTSRRRSCGAVRRSRRRPAAQHDGQLRWRLDTDEITFPTAASYLRVRSGVPVTLELIGAASPDDLRSWPKDRLARRRRGSWYESGSGCRTSRSILRGRTPTRPPSRRHVEFVGAMQDVTQRRLAERSPKRARSSRTFPGSTPSER